MKNVILTAAITLGTFVFANAQSTSSVSQTVTLTLQNSITLSITAATGTGFTFATTNDYQNSLTNTNASSFSVSSNRPWAVTVAAAAANFSGPASPAPVMPASALNWRLNGGSTFAGLSTTAASLTSGARGTSTFSVDYKANPGFGYDAGTYTMAVVYTATQQ